MNNPEKTLKISILGKVYTVVTDECELDVQAAAEIVSGFFLQKGQNPAIPHNQALERMAAIVALQTAIELVKARKALSFYENACSGLSSIIEKAL